MILPTKHVRADRALLGVGAELLRILRRPCTVSKLWDELRAGRSGAATHAPISYDWFILALDLLFIMGAIELERGIVRRRAQ